MLCAIGYYANKLVFCVVMFNSFPFIALSYQEMPFRNIPKRIYSSLHHVKHADKGPKSFGYVASIVQICNMNRPDM